MAVMGAIKAHENLEISGNDDVEVDAPAELRPTCREFYQAASVITRYMDGMDSDPIAHAMIIFFANFLYLFLAQSSNPILPQTP